MIVSQIGGIMGYRLDNKEIDIPGKRMTKIGTGSTGDVYKYKNIALKVFKKDKNPPIDFETAKYLTSISTERILLPRNLLFYNQSFKGYTYKLVPKKGSGKKIITLPKEALVENIESLEKDTKKISNKKVLLNGIEPSNCIFNGNLFVSDPSQYSILESFSTKELEALNQYQIHMLLTSLILSEIRRMNLGSSIERHIKEWLEEKDIEENTSAYLENQMNAGESIKQFLLRR